MLNLLVIVPKSTNFHIQVKLQKITLDPKILAIIKINTNNSANVKDRDKVTNKIHVLRDISQGDIKALDQRYRMSDNEIKMQS